MSEPIRLWRQERVDEGGVKYARFVYSPHEGTSEWTTVELPMVAIPSATYAALSARVAKLEAALRFYAEPDVYIFRETTDDGGITPVLVINDGGAKARAALEEPCKGDSPEAAEEDKS